MSGDLPEIGELPEGWAMTAVRDVTELLQYGISTKADADARTGVPVLRMGNIQDGRLDLANLKYVPNSPALNSVRLARGDILFNRTNSPELVGKSAVVDVDEDMVFASYLIRLRAIEAVVEPRYLCWWINSGWGREWAARVRTDGVSQSNINGKNLGEMPVPLAPVSEQRRIVEAVEVLLEQVSRAKGRLERVARILKRFRQSVLAAACSGKLTEEWRDNHGDAGTTWPGAEPASRPEWLTTPPSSWSLRSLDDISERVSVGYVGPTTQYYCSSDVGVSFVRSQNVRPRRLVLEGVQYITKSFHQALRKSQLKAGDLLVVRVGANRGDACVVPSGLGELNCANIVFARPLLDASAWVGLYANSPEGQKQLQDMTTGSAQGVLNTTAVAKLLVPLPSIREQAEVLRRVDQLFALADTIERRVKLAAARADKLPQAILQKAFSGELVPTEAELARAEGRSYESAEQLLARAKAQPPTAGAKPARGRARTTAKPQ